MDALRCMAYLYLIGMMFVVGTFLFLGAPLTPGIVGLVAYGVAILAIERLAILCGVIK